MYIRTIDLIKKQNFHYSNEQLVLDNVDLIFRYYKFKKKLIFFLKIG